MLTPRQHKAGEAAFPCHENTTFLECITMLGSGKFRPDLPSAQEAFIQPSPFHLHELCHPNSHRVMQKSWGDLYLLAPVWCHGEHTYRTANGAFWVTTHLLVDRNCLFVCLRGPQHAVSNSSYPSQSSFSAHWAGDSATSCFIILESFQKNISWQNKTKTNKTAFTYFINTSIPHAFCNPNTTAQTTWKWDYFALFIMEFFTKKWDCRNIFRELKAKSWAAFTTGKRNNGTF